MCKIEELKEKLLFLPDLPIFIAGHKNPDQDSIGSCLCLCRFLRHFKKDAWVLLKKEEKSLVLWQNIDDLVVKNIDDFLKTIQSNQNVVKNEKKDINLNINDLNVSKISGQKKYIFIALDLNDLSRLDNHQDEYLNATLKLNIDHHQGNSTNADFVFSCDKESSTCEILFKLIEKTDKSLLTLDNCENLYCGILTDTNCFSRRITKRTFDIAQQLINLGVDYYKLNRLVLWGRTVDELVCSGLLAQSIVDEKTFHYVVCDKTKTPMCNLSQSVLVKKVAEDLRKIDGINILVFLIDYKDKFVAKVMTNDCEIADKISSQFAGGGGHKKEAGFTTTLSIQEILSTISAYISKTRK